MFQLLESEPNTTQSMFQQIKLEQYHIYNITAVSLRGEIESRAKKKKKELEHGCIIIIIIINN